MKRKTVPFIYVVFMFLLVYPAVVSAQQTSIFTVYGEVFLSDGLTYAPDGNIVTVKNLNTGVILSTTTGDIESGKYSVIFVDFTSNRAAAVGDQIKITVESPEGELLASPDPYTVTAEHIANRRIEIDTIVDSTPPSLPVVSDDGEYTNSAAQLHAHWTSTDEESDISEYQYAIGTTEGGIDVVSWTSVGTDTEVTTTGLSLTDGKTYYFGVKAQNGAGLWSDVGVSDGIIVDTILPTTEITLTGTSGNNGWYTSKVTVTLSASDVTSGVNFTKYRIDGGEWEIYSSPFEITIDGEHTVDYYSLDNAGNRESTKSESIKVDTTAPTTDISLSGTSGENGWYTSTVTGTLSASDATSGVDFTKYKIDNGGWNTYNSPFDITDDGEHIVSYYSLDKAGNQESTKSVTIKIDTTAPTTDISLSSTSGENDWYTSKITATLSASDATSGVAETKYRIDGGDWQTYTSPFDITTDGTHTVEYYSVDNAGNKESTKSETIKIDTTPPTDFELQYPEHDSWAKSDELTFTWAASSDAISGLAKYQLYIDENVNQDDIPRDQTSSPPASPLSEGDYTWKVVAFDVVGNTKESTSTFRVKIDGTAPQTTLEIGEPKFISGGITYVHPSTLLTLSADDGTGSGADVTEYKIDSTNWTTYSDPFTVQTAGSHTVSYHSKDKVGNVETEKSVYIFVDNQPPGEFDLVSPDNGVLLIIAKPTFIWGESNDGDSGFARYEIWIDGSLNSSVSGTSATPGDVLNCGEHEWTVIAYDNVGNSRNASSTRTFKIDVDKPVCEITAPPDGHIIGGTQYTISGNAADAGEADCVSDIAKVEIRFKKDSGDWGDWQACALGNSWSYVWTGYEEGAYTFVARATDVAGNVGNPSAPRSVTVNLEPPSVQTTTVTPEPAKAGTVAIAIQFKVNISDGMNNDIPPDVKIVTAGDSETIPVTQVSYVGVYWTGTAEISDTMANGMATIQVSGATDNNGGVMVPNNNAGSFVIDTVAPTVSDVTVVPDPAKVGTITVTVIFTEETSGLNVNVSPLVAFTPPGAATPIPVTQSEYVKATRTWTGTATITEEMPNGEAIVKVSGAEDMAGNVMPPDDQAGTFIIDTIKIGDVNADGVITPRDASLIAQHVAGSINLLEAPYNVPLEKVDVTGNGTISTLDAALVMYYITGLIKEFPRTLMEINM